MDAELAALLLKAQRRIKELKLVTEESRKIIEETKKYLKELKRKEKCNRPIDDK